ncbi:MAG: SUMF1/EgtB/PvdO family nonheme iron enzyme [Segetibacter sp.]
MGFAQDSSHPVVCINWDDANDYVHWLSKKTGLGYRLLSEAEWEYAARAGTTTTFPWGAAASHEYANYGMDSTYTALKLGRDQWLGTSPVGSFPPNQFGLYDMNGNIMQWVKDCYSNSYISLPTDGSAYKTEIKLKMTGNNFSWMNGKSSCLFHMISWWLLC